MTDSPTLNVSSGHRTRVVVAVLSGLLVAASAALVGRMLLEAKEQPALLPPPDFVAESDATELGRRVHDVVGKFATGKEAGDRVIEFAADGRVQFYVLGPLRNALEYQDRYRIGSIARRPAIATSESGSIEIVDIDRLKYFGDTYERTK